MVGEISIDGKMVYVCDICKLGYADVETANECEEFCRSHNACSLEITRKAIHTVT